MKPYICNHCMRIHDAELGECLMAYIENQKGKSAGTVKWWNDSKGYGFIECGNQDLFTHYTALMMDGFKTLSEGQKVSFDILDGPKGPQAMNVRVDNAF